MDKRKSLLDPVEKNLTGDLKISIFMPTHRKEPDNRGDAIVFKNLMKELEEKLKEYPDHDMANTLASLNDLQKDNVFWNHGKSGLAILATSGDIEIYRLGYPVAKSVKVGNTFHILPLLKHLEGLDEAYLADLSRNRVSLYQFDGVEALKVTPKGLEQEFSELFDDFDPQDLGGSASFKGQVGTVHANYSKTDEEEKDREKYFRYLDQGFDKLHYQNRIPVILAGTKDNIAVFKDLAKGDFYTQESIERPLDSMSQEEVRERASWILETRAERVSKNTSDNAAVAMKDNLAETDDAKIAKLAQEGRVSELLIKESVLGENRQDLDEIIRDVYATSARVRLVKDRLIAHEGSVLAILRY